MTGTQTHTHTHSHSHEESALLLATDACREAGHVVAGEESTGGTELMVCVTCSQEWGRMKGLRDWQEHCPCCFSEAHPNGLRDLGITAEVWSLSLQPHE